MSASRPGLLRRLFGGLWLLIDRTRRVALNLLFLAIVVALLAPLLFGHRPHLTDRTALVLNPGGSLVEQFTGGAREAALAQALGELRRETQLHDLIDAVDAAARDPKITRIALVLDDLDAAGLPQLREAAAALQRFRATGKQVLAWGSGFDQRQYYLAAHADAVYLDPAGAVELHGFGGLRNYYRDLLDRAGVTVNVFRAGKFKSFAEPYVNNAPSAPALEADNALLGDAWATYTGGIEQARHLAAGSVARMIDELPQRMAAADGDGAKMALAEKLVDGLTTREEFRELMIERGGKRDPQSGSFVQVALDGYVALQAAAPSDHDHVAVVTAAGEIIDGKAPQGVIGARTVADLIRRVRLDDRARAIVLRVDSPGGSAFGSELVRRELELARNAGKPVVVSMGDVAASGGFWISQAADEVLADPATVTGSIGVIGIMPTFDRTLDKLGVHAAGAGTSWLSTAMDPRQPLDPRFGSVLQLSIGHVYREFLARVAAARGSTPEQIDQVAQGRVWTGRQAQQRGLVDTLGGLHEALQSAARRAKLGDRFEVVYVQEEPRGLERWLRLLPETLARAVDLRLQGVLPAPLAQIGHELAWLQPRADPLSAVYAHCLCVAP